MLPNSCVSHESTQMPILPPELALVPIFNFGHQVLPLTGGATCIAVLPGIVQLASSVRIAFLLISSHIYLWDKSAKGLPVRDGQTDTCTPGPMDITPCKINSQSLEDTQVGYISQ